MAANLNKYKVDAYKSPYTEELFAIADVDKFQKHLRDHANDLRRTTKRQQQTNSRLAVWSNIRKNANSIDDVFQQINLLSPDFIKHYRGSFDRKLLPVVLGTGDWLKQDIECYDISHTAPIGHATNWGGYAEHLPRAKSALVVTLQRTVNVERINESIYANASQESGITHHYDRLILFADDWTFVAVQTLWSVLDRKVRIPDKYRYVDGTVTSDITKDWEVFWQDINRYSIQHVGMPFTTLKGMYDLGAISDNTVLLQLAQRTQPIVGPAEISLSKLGFDADH